MDNPANVYLLLSFVLGGLATLVWGYWVVGECTGVKVAKVAEVERTDTYLVTKEAA